MYQHQHNCINTFSTVFCKTGTHYNFGTKLLVLIFHNTAELTWTVLFGVYGVLSSIVFILANLYSRLVHKLHCSNLCTLFSKEWT